MPITALFGGTFNPFHIGHFEMLKALQNDNDIEKILLIPDKIPPHKSADFLASAEVRIEMCRKAADGFDKAEVCLIEFERQGKSYTYDTVLELKKRYPNDKLCFVMGGDMLVYFDKWYKADELMHLLSFIVFRRSDTDEKEFNSSIMRFREMGMEIKVMDEIIPLVSSTEIRSDFEGKKELLTPEIYEFLSERGVYGE